MSMRSIMPMCHLCKHHYEWRRAPQDEVGWSYYCDAYPDGSGVPLALIDDFGHFHPLDGDHGLQFEPKDDITPEEVAFYRDVVYGGLDEDED